MVVSAFQLSREERAVIRLARYKKRAAAERAAARKRKPATRKITGGKPHASELPDKAWLSRKRRRKMALFSRRRNRR